MFIDSNLNKFARDVSKGEGETLDALASLMEMNQQDKDLFSKCAKANFDRIFSHEGATSEEVIASLREVVSENAELAEYSRLI